MATTEERAENTIDREDLARRFTATTDDVRARRLPIEDEWLKSHDAWIGVQTYTFYQSEFRHFIPTFRRTVEKMVTRQVAQLMPHHEFYQIFPGDEADIEADMEMTKIHRFMDWLLTDHIKIRKVAKQLVRTFDLYSRCITKSTIRVYDMPKMRHGRVTGTVQQVWPTCRAVDPFNFYVWPETVASMDEAILVFEDVIMPYQEYEEAVKLGLADAINPDDLGSPVWPWHLSQRLDRIGMITPTPIDRSLYGSGTTAAGMKQPFVQLAEIYFRGAGNRWIMGWLVRNLTPTKFTRLHFSRYPRPPYRMAVARELPGQHYTPGMGQDIEALQVLLNDQFNQGEEARAVASGPPVILDPGKIKRADSYVFGYRRKWYGDPTGVKLLEIPDTSVSALRAAQFTMAYMEGFGPSGLMQGQPPRGTPRGSSAVAQLVSMAGADIVDSAKTIEEECLTPTIQDLFDLVVAFTPDLQLLQIPGAEGMKPLSMNMNELFGGWQFKWMGASHFQDKQADAQQAMVYFQNLIRMSDQLHQQGWKIDWATLNRILWKDILGERRLANILQPMTPEERQQELLLQRMTQMAAQNAMGGGGQRGSSGPTAAIGGPQGG